MNTSPVIRFCVMVPGYCGPTPFFANTMLSVIRLLSRYCNNSIGHGVTVWERKTLGASWKLITDAS